MKHIIAIAYAILVLYVPEKIGVEKNWVYLITVGPLLIGGVIFIQSFADNLHKKKAQK